MTCCHYLLLGLEPGKRWESLPKGGCHLPNLRGWTGPSSSLAGAACVSLAAITQGCSVSGQRQTLVVGDAEGLPVSS